MTGNTGSILVAGLAAVASLVAAVFWFMASLVEVRPDIAVIVADMHRVSELNAYAAAAAATRLPTAEIAVMGPKGAVEIIFRDEIGDEKKIEKRTEDYKDRFASPFAAAHRGYIDDVIMPHSTRRRLCRSLAMLRDKEQENPWKKHSNIPL